MVYGWKGNRRSGVALAMCHRLGSLVPIKRDEHPDYALQWSNLPVFLSSV